jgi:hypothetical protein
MVTTESGLQYKDIKVGQGPSPPVGFQVLTLTLFFYFLGSATHYAQQHRNIQDTLCLNTYLLHRPLTTVHVGCCKLHRDGAIWTDIRQVDL